VRIHAYMDIRRRQVSNYLKHVVLGRAEPYKCVCHFPAYFIEKVPDSAVFRIAVDLDLDGQ